MGMIGSHYWRNKRHGLNKCDEGGREHCSDHVDCCAVTACTYCFELEIYGEAVQKVSSNRTDNHWTGTVGNVLFDMYWDRDYDTDECVLIVEANGEEVYRKSCYEGQSCRDSSDEVSITVDYEDAVLRWIKHESRPLPHRIDPDTGCKVWFCGECECSCRELCVTVTDPAGAITKGELSDVSYDDCEGPVWSGTVGDYELELALGWDIYDQCVLLVKVDGVEQDAVAVTGCKDLSATIELYDGTVISVKCKICSCEALYNSLCCPEPLGPVVYVTGGLIVGSVALTCQNCTAENQEDYIARVYTGEYVTDWMYAVGYGSLCSVTHNWKAKIRLFFTWTCGSGMNLSIHASVAENAPGYDVAVLDATVVENVVVECSPLFNVYENLCPANDWYFAPNPCFGAIARCTEFPETYVVTE